jgi:hypothetical protein
LVSAEQLGGLLEASETDSTNIPQMAWLPGTHRLLCSGWTCIVQTEGESQATPSGLFWVDADSGEGGQLLPPTENVRFARAPNGEHLALISLTGLSFLDLAGGGRGPAVLSYPRVGMQAALPSGVWTRDSTAFVITGPIQGDAPAGSDLSIWRPC